jgi:hypothetical protein
MANFQQALLAPGKSRSLSTAVRSLSRFFVVCTLLLGASVSALTDRSQSSFLRTFSIWGQHPSRSKQRNAYTIGSISRGGAEVDEEDEYDYDDEDEEEEEEVEEYDEEDETEDDGVQIEVQVEKYDEPLIASPLTNLFVSLGVMLLAKRVDLFNPKIVKIARFGYITYLIALQIFVMYVRFQAKSLNNRTPITLKNPLSGVLQSQLGAGGENSMVKNLASSFLSNESTVMEYDMRQARSMQSGVLFNMLFMWFLHFKMKQTQPLIIQSLTGVSNMIYSPLFQVYILGRNLERPFKNPSPLGMPEGLGEAEVGDGDGVEQVKIDEVEDQALNKVVDDDDEEEEEDAQEADDEVVSDEEAEEVETGDVSEDEAEEGETGDVSEDEAEEEHSVEEENDESDQEAENDESDQEAEDASVVEESNAEDNADGESGAVEDEDEATEVAAED